MTGTITLLIAAAVAGVVTVAAVLLRALSGRSPVPDAVSGVGPATAAPLADLALTELPGANCGACGHPTCFAASRALASGTAFADVCVTGGAPVREALTRLGVPAPHGPAR